MRLTTIFPPRFRRSWYRNAVYAVSFWCATASLCTANTDYDAALALVRRAVESHAGDWARFDTCAGTGTMAWIHADLERRWECDMSFQLANSKMWMSLASTLDESDLVIRFDEMELVADGTTIAAVLHWPRFNPAGCEVFIHPDDRKGLAAAVSHGKVDLRACLIPEFFRTDPSLGFERFDADVSMQAGDEAAVIVRYPGQHWVYRFSEARGGRLSSMEGYASSDPMAQSIDSYTYRLVDGQMEPATYVHEELSRTVDRGYNRFVVTFDHLGSEHKGRRYNLAALRICNAARLIDRRWDSTVKVRNVSTAVLEAFPSEDTANLVSKMPERYGDPAVVGSVPKLRSTAIKWVLLLNAGVVLLLATAWIAWRRKPPNDL